MLPIPMTREALHTASVYPFDPAHLQSVIFHQGRADNADHTLIVDQAITLLPAELKPFFEKRRAFIVERSIDPDLWRNVGWTSEPPNHFLDLDHPAGIIDRPSRAFHRHPFHESGAGDGIGRAHSRHRHR